MLTLTKNISRIIKKHGIEKLIHFNDNNSLHKLDGVGKKTIVELKEYLKSNNNSNIDQRIIDIKIHFKSILYDNENKIKKNMISKVKEIEECIHIDKLYENYWWIINLNEVNLQRQFKLFIFCLENLELNDFKPYLDIISDPMILLPIFQTNFKTIDNISIMNEWWELSSFYRIKNFLVYLFEEYKNDGHVYFTDNNFEYFIKEYEFFHKDKYDFLNKYSIDKKLIELNIKHLIQENILIKIKFKDSNKYGWCLRENYDCEKNISKYLKNILNSNLNSNLKLNNLKYDDEHFNIYNNDEENKITEEQIKAITGCLDNKISILCGGPGTGKTSTVIRKICQILVKNNKKVLFLAPTHAAKNRGREEILQEKNKEIEQLLNKNLYDKLSENTEFTTLQSAIFQYNHYDNESKEHIEKSKMDSYIEIYDYIIIDESSMITSNDFCELLYYINNTKISLLLVGDPNQLPAIGMGCPFNDLINSNYIPTFTLTKNFRAKKSDIPNFLEKVKINNSFINNNINNKNVHAYFNENFIDKLEELLIDFKSKNIYPYDGKDVDKTFQIITPFNDTIKNEGIIQLVREIFFDNYSDDLFEINDIIIMNKNTPYFKNGDYAKIIDKNIVNNHIEFNIELLNEKIIPKKVRKEDEDIINLISDTEIKLTLQLKYYKDNSYFKPSFAISVHKSQGLGFNNVITIYNKWGKPLFINKKLNYTAFSRSKDNIYILGDKKFYRNPNDKQRNTLIVDLLKDNISLRKKKDIKLSFNNIIDTPEIIEKCKNNRKKIPKKLRQDVWEKRNNKSYFGKCFVCNKEIDICDFHVGHNKSIFNGGTDHLNNLEPICCGCNLSMGKENLDFYKSKYYK